MFDSVSKVIQSKLGEHDYKGALSVATKYRDTLTSAGGEVNNADWVHSYSRCVEYVGDCYLGLNNPEAALREYEQSLGMGAKLFSPTDDPNMLLLFKIEKALEKMGERLGSAGTLKPLDERSGVHEVEEHQRRWRANLLLTAKERMATTQTTIDEKRVMKQTHLNMVWKETIKDSQKRKEAAKSSREMASREFPTELFGINRMWLEVGVSTILLIGIFVITSFNVVNSTQIEPVPSNETEAAMLAEMPSTSAYIDNRTFTVQGPPEDKLSFEKNEAVINADLDAFSVPYYSQCQSILDLPGFMLFAMTKKSTWLKRSPYGLETSTGKVLFDVSKPEYKLANYINEYVGSAAETGEKPEGDYTNPYTQTVQSVQFGNVKDGSIDDYVLKLKDSFELTPGTIICAKEKVRPGLNRYYGIAVGREDGLLVPLGVGAERYLSDTDQKKRLLNSLGKPDAIIVSDPSAKDALLLMLASMTGLCLAVGFAPIVETGRLKLVFQILSAVSVLVLVIYLMMNS
ncbi:MAG: hypothetical protein SGJ27_29710 [Candidatus Melainabacteria bacterium]|nr:hypothetical protein [Candidatus Melainabacteria bacterium]